MSLAANQSAVRRRRRPTRAQSGATPTSRVNDLRRRLCVAGGLGARRHTGRAARRPAWRNQSLGRRARTNLAARSPVFASRRLIAQQRRGQAKSSWARLNSGPGRKPIKTKPSCSAPFGAHAAPRRRPQLGPLARAADQSRAGQTRGLGQSSSGLISGARGAIIFFSLSLSLGPQKH